MDIDAEQGDNSTSFVHWAFVWIDSLWKHCVVSKNYHKGANAGSLLTNSLADWAGASNCNFLSLFSLEKSPWAEKWTGAPLACGHFPFARGRLRRGYTTCNLPPVFEGPGHTFQVWWVWGNTVKQPGFFHGPESPFSSQTHAAVSLPGHLSMKKINK